MCGIAGIVNFENRSVEGSDIKRMLDKIRHRGPDGEGVFTHERVGLGHRRLSIIDLTEGGNQPMERDGLMLTYNGEIYNYLELKEELRQLGHQFHTTSDSEVLLAAYIQWGESCTTRFNGMWSFAILDRKASKLFCSRDRFGEKPFYYSISNGRFVFCSEIKGLNEALPPAKADMHAVAQYLIMNQVDTTNDTFFDGIKKLPASHNGVFDLNTNTFKVYRYYDLILRPDVKAMKEDEIVALYMQEFERSISWRLRSDVKVATSLSGGLDSSFLASIASKLYHKTSQERFTAITASSVDPYMDETNYAAMLVKHSDLNWIVTQPATDTFLDVLDDVLYTQEEPFHSASIVMQYFVMKAAHEAGIIVMLDGQGADETLMGYYQHITNYLLNLPLHKKPKGFLQVVDRFAISPIYLTQLYFYFASSSLRARRQRSKWSDMKQEFKGDFLDMTITNEMAKRAKGPYFDFQKYELQTEALPKLLRYADKNAMRYSIETRLPFLDHELVEIAISADDALKVKDGWSKNILRKAMTPHVPQEITWRKRKIGYAAPEKNWLADKSVFAESIHSSRILQHMMRKIEIPQDDNAMFWRMLCLAGWEKAFNVQV